MGQKRRQAIAEYRRSLLQRFGKGAQTVIDAEVAGLSTLAKLAPEDLVRVERAVVARLRDQRSDAGSVARSASAGSIRSSGASIVGSQKPSRAASVQSHDTTPRFKPKVKIPERPQQRPADQWDLILRYDQSKFAEDERMRHVQRRAQQQLYKNELDHQMMEILDRRQFFEEEKRRDKEAILLEKERISRDEELEHQRQEEKNKAVAEGCRQAVEMKRRQAKREERRLEAERDDLLRQVQREELEDAQKEALRRDRLRRRAQEIEEHVRNETEVKAKRKIAEGEEEKRMMQRYARELDQKEEERQGALQAMQDRMKSIANTVGKAVGDSAANKEAEDEQKMVDALQAAEQKAKETEAEKKEVHRLRNKDLQQSLQDQINTMEIRKRKDAAEWALQGKIWKEEADEGLAKDKRDEHNRRVARQNLDKDLFKQMYTDGIDEEQRMMPKLRHREMELNQDIFRQMVVDGFSIPDAKQYLIQPGAAKP